MPATKWERLQIAVTAVASAQAAIDQTVQYVKERKGSGSRWPRSRTRDECVQLHGGYGYMWDYPVARAWADARVQRIYGGTNEIMKEVISRAMGLPGR